MAEKKKREKFTTPKGVAVYPRITGTPDTKFDKEGVWKIGVRLSGDEAETLKATIDGAMEASLADAQKAVVEKRAEQATQKGPKKKIADAELASAPYSEEEGGDIVFNFKMKASGVREDGTAWERKPKVFDRFGKLIMDAKVGGGSEVQVSYEMNPFYKALTGAGVSLRLEAVRVVKLVEFVAGGDATQFGFENDAEEETEEETSEESTEETNDDF